MRYLRIAAIALILAGGTQACHHSTPFDDEEVAPDSKVELIVENQNISEMDIYAVSDGVATRVGTVSGLAKKQFALNGSLYQSQDFRIVATPFGGNGRASTGPIIVHAGQTIEFIVRTTLRTSTVSVR